MHSGQPLGQRHRTAHRLAVIAPIFAKQTGTIDRSPDTRSARQNVEHYRDMLAKEPDEHKRAVLSHVCSPKKKQSLPQQTTRTNRIAG